MEQTYNVEDLGKLKELLRSKERQTKKEYSKKEAISFLAGEIVSLFRKNYSENEVSAILKEQGIDIAPSTLRVYLREREKTKTPRKSRARPKTTTEETDNPVLPEQESLAEMTPETPATPQEEQVKRETRFQLEPDSDEL